MEWINVKDRLPETYLQHGEDFSSTKSLIWQLKEHPNYKWSQDKRLYNCKTGREIKKTINGGSVGYWIKGKWHSLSTLKNSIEKIPCTDCPF